MLFSKCQYISHQPIAVADFDSKLCNSLISSRLQNLFSFKFRFDRGYTPTVSPFGCAPDFPNTLVLFI